MKKNQVMKWLQNKFVLAALLMVLVAGTAAAGVVALRNDGAGEQKEQEDPGYAFQTEEESGAQHQQLALPTDEALEGLQDPDSVLDKPNEDGEDHDTQRPVQSGDVDAVVSGDEDLEGAEADQQDGTGNAGSALADDETLVDGENAVVYEPENEDGQEVAVQGAALDFRAGSTLSWPIFGNIILDYSMDTTIYFPTLEQYKCNPGILIQAEVGQPVEAAVRGVVTAIGSNEELGNFIMMDLGGDYSIVYGQLQDLTVSVGQLVEAGEVMGVVAQPTKYYVVEGPNIYLELRHHQEPVDPLDYIR